MTAYLASYLPAIKSLLPRSSPSTAPLPAIGDSAPTPLGDLDLSKGTSQPTLVAFVRHCGCPFAEKEVKILGQQATTKDVHVVIVQHSEMTQVKEWFKAVGGEEAFPSPSSYTLVADPERKIYAQWGIGTVGWAGMISPSIMGSLKKLQEEGIDLRPTGEGSWRWQNSGGFALDKEGKIRWIKLAKDASDVCDYAQAASTVV